MFAAIQPPLKLSPLSLTLEAHAAELLSSLWEREKNKSMHLILGRGKGGKRMQLVLGRVGSHPFSLLVFIAPKVCGGVWDQGCPYPPFRLSWVGFYSHSPLG